MKEAHFVGLSFEETGCASEALAICAAYDGGVYQGGAAVVD
jgi:hypothetical protein